MFNKSVLNVKFIYSHILQEELTSFKRFSIIVRTWTC